MTKELEALERIKKSHHIAIAIMGCERDYETEKAIDTVEQALLKAQEQEKVIKEILFLINDLEPTFNRKGVSNDTDILGTIIKDYFYDNASDLLREVLCNDTENI